ncbi:MAG: hypothetical protein A2499_08255 [Stygiobacter sp. RIFOXYC12_FULL_38_8]|nr:MAG: hypothetical protein A2X62_11150 [Stygiobacter sp. GWC2_38_9]OGU84214.1 MAG: hypothetical protein A2279_06270 [Stygiobacter sp. RIFOXYA12_FULL_38_9]OGV08246.1 MAG: hypothetical protein A2299_09350 [Stygiobacter sp. RIFOXYB2_FULL_37_11]OGV10099.1 MAG: hypothetical protein A2237_09755 [Stygiobacter sp. RIFOXYA2_FULL_38_8]OGV15761.1 MAG: hypothetical protein A2440_01780 [Stygiobacter sp. RIFOXYC2_FULL_38_25]OGV28366.1 MAG: hypothetical protein A2499_08255 [Stygiobacter sp. RIFOXYC12_FULL_
MKKKTVAEPSFFCLHVKRIKRRVRKGVAENAKIKKVINPINYSRRHLKFFLSGLCGKLCALCG